MSAYGKTLDITPPDSVVPAVFSLQSLSSASSGSDAPAHISDNLIDPADLVFQPMADDHVDLPDDLGIARALIPPDALRVRLIHVRPIAPDSPPLKRRPKPPRDFGALA